MTDDRLGQLLHGWTPPPAPEGAPLEGQFVRLERMDPDTHAADLRVVPIEDPTPIRTPGLLWKKGANRSPMVKHMASVIRRAAG